MISISDLLILIVGGVVSFSVGFSGLIGPSISSSPPPHAVSKLAAVHMEIVLIVVEARGAMLVILFILAGIMVGVVTGPIELVNIHVLTKAFLTALFVLSKKLPDLLEFMFDSIGLKESELLVMSICVCVKTFAYID